MSSSSRQAGSDRDRLRGRILLALGATLAPACKEAERPSAPLETITVVTADAGKLETNGKSAIDALEPRTCRKDEVLEHACGMTSRPNTALSPSACGEDATNLVSQVDAQTLLTANVFRLQGPEASGFTRDDELTERTRRRLAGTAPNSESTCCFSRCTKVEVAASAPPLPTGEDTMLRCTPLFRAGTTFPAAGVTLCAAAVAWNDGGGYGTSSFESRTNDTCCYRTVRPRPMIMRGRPMREDGAPVIAATSPGVGAWSVPDAEWLAPGIALSAVQAARAAHAWAEDALHEHASVAAFARLALDLLALGAPPDLVERAHVAASDEIRHAKTAFAIAAALGEPRTPGRMPIGRGPSSDVTLTRLATETFVEGCVGESIAAMELAEASRRCLSPPIAAALARMAEDEASHAELAWRIVDWALREGGREVANALAEAQRALATPDATAATVDLTAVGILGPDDRMAIARATLRDVIAPSADQLLDRARHRETCDPRSALPCES